MDLMQRLGEVLSPMDQHRILDFSWEGSGNCEFEDGFCAADRIEPCQSKTTSSVKGLTDCWYPAEAVQVVQREKLPTVAQLRTDSRLGFVQHPGAKQ
jgi:hypothetical protein